MTTSWIGPLLVSFAIAAAVTPILRRVALRADFVDHPTRRKFHANPVPYLGGVAIMVGTLGAVMLGPTPAMKAVVVGLGAVALGLVGLLDDRFQLQAAPRLLVQLAAAVAVVAVGIRVDVIGVAAIDTVITVAWLVALTNAMNLVDNMDGLSGGLTVAMGTGAIGLAAFSDQSVVGAIAAALAGAALGFLVWNLSSRRIFMGDAGALFVGFVLGVVIVEVSPLGGRWTGVVVAALLVGIPMLDVVTVMVARHLHGIRVQTAGQDHLSHRLVRRGVHPRASVAILVVAQLALSVAAVAVGRHTLPAAAGVAIGAAVAVALGLATWTVPVYDRPTIDERRRRLRRMAPPVGVGLAALVTVLVQSPGDETLPAVLVRGSSGLAADVVLGVAIALVLAFTASFTILGTVSAPWDLTESER